MKKTIIIILTFISIAVLGVGIAYAYFSARILGTENASTISLTGGIMTIEYSENSGVIELSGIYPKDEAWATKIITVKGTNSTNASMKYDLGLNVTRNDFRNSYISYDLKLIDGDNGTPISNITGKYINGTGYKRFGIGIFQTANNEIHQYELKIYFKNNGKDQNDAQRAIFNAKVEIRDAGSDVPESERTMFLGGGQVNIKMKTLANIANNDDTIPVAGTANTTITAIKESSTEPSYENKEEKNIVSTATSKYPIYMWYDNGTIYWWSEEKYPYLYHDSSRFFQNLNRLSDISGVVNWNVSTANNIIFMFIDNSQLVNIAPLSNWDVSNVTAFSYLFQNTGINDLSPLANWNISNSNNMTQIFSGTSIETLQGLENWDVSNVTALGGAFGNINNLSDLSGISTWDVSKVTNMDSTFAHSGIVDITPLSTWDVSNVTSMYGTFGWTKITNLDGLKNWDVSNVTSMSSMFILDTYLTDVSEINDWNINKNGSYSSMFGYLSIHPEFTKVQGTWENGTFTPNS